MSYMVISPYTLGLPCETLEAAENALYLLQCVGGFGQIVEVNEETVALLQEVDLIHNASEMPASVVAASVAVLPKPKPGPRSTK